MSTPRPAVRPRVAALIVCAALLCAVAWVAGGWRVGVPAEPRSSDAVRLGPQPGQPVSDYLAGVPGRLPPPGAPSVPALVQFDPALDGPGAASLLAGVRPVTAVFRVPLARVQTALRFQPLSPVDDVEPGVATRRQLGLAQAAAWRTAAADSARLTGRPARVAAAESGALAAPGCRCVLAVLVTGDRAGLESLIGRPGVRVVDAAPVGTPVVGVALAPLLPEQTTVAGPVLDDGPVPPP